MVELNRTQQEIVKLLLENTRTEAFVQDGMDKLMKTEWIVCLVCNRKMHKKIREDTELKTFLSTARKHTIHIRYRPSGSGKSDTKPEG